MVLDAEELAYLRRVAPSPDDPPGFRARAEAAADVVRRALPGNVSDTDAAKIVLNAALAMHRLLTDAGPDPAASLGALAIVAASLAGDELGQR